MHTIQKSMVILCLIILYETIFMLPGIKIICGDFFYDVVGTLALYILKVLSAPPDSSRRPDQSQHRALSV